MRRDPGAAGERLLGLRNPPRIRLDATGRDARHDHHAVLDTKGDYRHAERKIAGAPAEFIEAAAGIGGQDGQPHLGQQFVLSQRGGHDAAEEISRRDGAGAACASRHHLGIERRRHQAPLGGRIGVGDAAAEGAARADRMMRDVAHDPCQQAAERSIHHRLVERSVAHAGADREPVAVDRKARERLHPVDVDEMRRPRQTESHDRNETLPAGQHAAILAGDLRQRCDGFLDGSRRVIAKRRGLHRCGRSSPRRAVPDLGNCNFFGLMHSCRSM